MLGLGLHPRSKVLSSYSPEAKALFVRWSGASADQKAIMNQFILDCIADGNWSEMDACWMPANQDETNALQQLKSSSFTLTRVNSPGWLSGAGWISNSATSLLRTGFTPSVNGVKYALSSASIGVYSNTNKKEGKVELGVFDGSASSLMYSYNGDNIFYGNVNNDAASSGNSVSESVGLKCAVESAANTVKTYNRGVNNYTGASTQVGRPTKEFYLLALNNNGSGGAFSNKRVCFAFVGSKNLNMTLLNTTVKKYLKSLWLLDDDVAYWYDSRPTQPPIEELGIMYEFIKGTKVDNSLSSFSDVGDLMYIYGSPTEDNSMKNVFNKPFDVIKVNSPAWVANQGYTSDALTSYVKFSYSPETDGSAISKNDFGMYAFLRQGSSGLDNECGIYGGADICLITPRTGVYFVYVNCLIPGVGSVGDPGTVLGFFSGVRKISSAQEGWLDGTLIGTDPTSSSNIPSGEFYDLARNNIGTAGSFSGKQHSFFAILKGSIDQAKFNTRFQKMRSYYGF